MAGLTRDSGALIAAERGDRRFWSLWERAISRDLEVTVPANVIAQVYRGARSAVVARLLKACLVEVVDARFAMAVGVTLARAGVRVLATSERYLPFLHVEDANGRKMALQPKKTVRV